MYRKRNSPEILKLFGKKLLEGILRGYFSSWEAQCVLKQGKSPLTNLLESSEDIAAMIDKGNVVDVI